MIKFKIISLFCLTCLFFNSSIANSKKQIKNEKLIKNVKKIELSDTITNYSKEKKLIIELITHNLYLSYLNINQLKNSFSYNVNNDMISKETLNALNELNLNLEHYYDWLNRFEAKTKSEIKTIEELSFLIKSTKEVLEIQKSYVKSKNEFEKKKLDKVFGDYKLNIIDFYRKYKEVR